MLCIKGLVNSRALPSPAAPSSRAASTNLLWKHRAEEYPDPQATTPPHPNPRSPGGGLVGDPEFGIGWNTFA
jgi:hypothetical protein